jgi:hypothetical protein
MYEPTYTLSINCINHWNRPIENSMSKLFRDGGMIISYTVVLMERLVI